MCRSAFSCAAALVLALGSEAWGQKIMQNWTPPRGAVESRVLSCTNPAPLGRVAFDDWICPQTGPLIRVCWYGVVLTPGQLALGRRYYVAIYSHGGVCGPANLLYQTCVTPDYRRFCGFDCRQRRVFLFSAPIPPPVFTQTVGTHYWLQISEEDATSARVGVEDFRWSAHLPIMNACATQSPFPPGCCIPDDCPNPILVDLTFHLSAATIAGTINLTARIPGAPAIFQMRLLTPAGDLVESMCLETDDGGNYWLAPEAPDGTYAVEVIGMGMRPLRGTVMIQMGMEARLDFPNVFYGNLDGDMDTDLADFQLLQLGFTGSL